MRIAIRLCLGLSLLLLSARGSAASLVDLFMQVPPPPADAASAAAWLREGRVAASDLTTLAAKLEQEKDSLAKPAAAVSAESADSPGVLRAVQGYDAYRAQNSGDKGPALVLAKRAAWISKRFDGVRTRMGTQAVGDHNAVDDELKAWGGLFRDWQASRLSIVEKADAELSAIGDISRVRDAGHYESIKAYRLAMIGEIEIELSIPRLAIERFSTKP